MRISTACGLGTAAALICLALAEWAGWPLWPAVLVVAVAGLLLVLQLRALEKGIALLPHRELFARYAAVCRFAAVRRLLGGIGDYVDSLQHQYSTSVEDIDSRMGSLQSQINPHFLYNTLECIRSEALIEGCSSIAKMSKAMGLFFRYSISQKENIVTIQGELDNIRNYCIIQNYRFEDKFVFKIEMEDEDDELLDCLIPKMTLQPLVENAIFHGLEPKAGQGEVKLWVTAPTPEFRRWYSELIRKRENKHYAYDLEKDIRAWPAEPVIRPLADGQRFELGGRVVTAYHCPGHTPGEMVLIDDKTRTLLCGDACNCNWLLNSELAPTGRACVEKSLAALEAIQARCGTEYDAGSVFNFHHDFRGFGQPLAPNVLPDLIQCLRSLLDGTAVFREVTDPLSDSGDAKTVAEYGDVQVSCMEKSIREVL